jgi:hypothetical protein
MDIRWHRDPSLVPVRAEYEAMVTMKTGTLARMAGEIGMLAGGKSSGEAGDFGELSAKIGVGFQVLDDVRNLTTGNPGKKRGDDIVEGKKSLPVILHLEKHPDDLAGLSAAFARARAEGIGVAAVPGASALLTALPAAGLPTDRFLFEGFLPSKRAARQKALSALAAVQATLVFYEAPSRLGATLEDMAKTLGAGRPAAVARELTKLFEETRTASLGDLAAHYRARPAPKGEIVVLVGPPGETETAAPEVGALLRQKLKTMSLRDAVAAVTALTGAKKKDVYRRALALDRK